MYIMNFFISFFTVVKVSYFLVKMSLLKQAFQLISVFPLLKLIAKFVFQIQPLSPICLIKPRITKVRCRHSLNSTMVSVSTVQTLLNQEFLCTYTLPVQVFRWPKKIPTSNLAFQAFKGFIGT